MDPYTIHRVDRKSAGTIEPLGSKPKFWFREGHRRILFKADDRGTGEDWAEVISCGLCRCLGLPHVEYELASEYQGQTYVLPGVICENMTSRGGELVLGNQLLLDVDSRYPAQERFHVRHHTLEVVGEVVATLAFPSAEWTKKLPDGIETAIDVFIGYLLLDAWIANQDRHHENWGAISMDALRLAPTFDHGAALARNLTDEERERRIVTKDKNQSVEAFVLRGRSALYRSVEDTKAMKLLDAFVEFAKLSPRAAAIWIERLQMIDADHVGEIIECVPRERMSEVTKRFTRQLLETNQRRISEIEF